MGIPRPKAIYFDMGSGELLVWSTLEMFDVFFTMLSDGVTFHNYYFYIGEL